MKAKQIEVVPYDYLWPKEFEIEARKIKEALGDNCLEIHHIGSTSVPGLAAKPIIDMLPVVKDISKVKDSYKAMEALGYEARGELGIPFRRFFNKGKDIRIHNIHVFEQGDMEIERHLMFRNWMVNNEKDKESYALLKQGLAKNFANDRFSYTGGKDDFIANINMKSGWNGLRIVITLTPKEWEEYNRIRIEQIFAPLNIIYDKEHPTLTDDQHYHFVLYKGKNIVSVAHIEFLGELDAAIRSIATDEPEKKKGYARHLLKQLERWIKQQGRNVIKLHAGLDAENFYRKLGYIDMEFDNVSISKDVIDLGKLL